MGLRRDATRSLGTPISAAVAVILAVMSAEIWRGWMGIEPTQDASTAPTQTVLKTVTDGSR